MICLLVGKLKEKHEKITLFCILKINEVGSGGGVDPDPDPLVRGTDPGSLRTKTSRIPNTSSLCPGIAVSGSGAGALVVPPLAAQLALRFGWRGCNRLVALLWIQIRMFLGPPDPDPLVEVWIRILLSSSKNSKFLLAS
jgi:hypothetical protein